MADDDQQDDKPGNPFDWTQEFLDLTLRSQQAAAQFWSGVLSEQKDVDLDPFNVADSYAEVMKDRMQNPDKLMEAQMRFYRDSVMLWESTMRRMMGMETEPVVEP